MKYEKPSLTFEQQADLLLARGLVADRDLLISRLRAVGYYRLSGYIYPFRLNDTEIQPGTTLETIWRHYIFDRQFRFIVMDAIERIEVAVRTHLAYHFANTHGLFDYFNPANLPGLKTEQFERWKSELEEELERSAEIFIKHYRAKYDEETRLPIWMLIEVMSFGKTLTFYIGVGKSIQNKIAALFGMPDVVFESWLRSLNVVRNICAHHSRLWNREFGYKPKIPGRRKYPNWHPPIKLNRGKVFIILTILRYLLQRCAHTTQWENRLKAHLAAFPEIPRISMGFPDGWEKSPLWQ